MEPLIMRIDITSEEITNPELRQEAISRRDNPTLTICRMTVSQTIQHEYTCEEVLYVGDQRMAAVAWEETVQLRDDVDSAEEAFRQVFHEMRG